MRDFSRHVAAATPPGRDRALDGLRALAVAGVVLGHWLVTALVVDSGALRSASPLRAMPELAPVSWVFQTLAVFFLVGGESAAGSLERARAGGADYRSWLRVRLGRLVRPVLPLALLWTVVCLALLIGGTDQRTVHALVKLAVSPLWFLCVFALLTACTPLVRRVHPLAPVAVVALADVLRLTADLPSGATSVLSAVDVVAAWLVPYSLGAARSEGGFTSRTSGWVLLLGGGAACALLVSAAGYPAAMVGVPGTERSNLDPPSLAAVTFGLAQCGAAFLVRGPLGRLLDRPVPWALVAAVNLWALTVFLWHQSALMAVTVTGLAGGHRLPGLHTPPDGPGWVLARLLWLPVFAAALLLCRAAFGTYEQRRSRGTGTVLAGNRPASKTEEHRA